MASVSKVESAGLGGNPGSLTRTKAGVCALGSLIAAKNPEKITREI
jgi:hypothetical protein